MVGLILFSQLLPAYAQPEAKAQLSINASRVESNISPLLYGQFIEFMFEDIKGGLHAELVRNRGFEEKSNAIGLSRYWERYPDNRNDDYGLSFLWDDSVAYAVSRDFFPEVPVQHALRVDAGQGVIERHGAYQPGIPLRSGVNYRGYCWMKTTGYEGRVVVALEADVTGGQTYAEMEIRDIRGDWKQYAFNLHSNQADPHARLAFLFYGRGRVWLDQVSLMPEDAVGGVRADVFERVAALHPAFIRWPGGNVAQDYHWSWGIGPRDHRPVWTNLSWRNEPEPSDFGTDEFIRFSRRVGAEPSLTVNVEGRGATPAEAAAWVEYCNGAVNTKYGSLRAANGHPEPYGVKYWEIGNEIWGDWVRGHSDAETYARNFKRYYDAMQAVDSTIRFTAVGDNNMDWNRTVLHLVGPYMDYLAIHHYYGQQQMAGDVGNLMAHALFYERFYQQVEQLIRREVPNHSITLNINEWGLDLPESRQYSMDAALYGARLMNVFERSNPLVGMSAVSDLINGWPGGIIQASRHGVFVSPLYYVNQLYNEHLGAQRLKIALKGPVFQTSREGNTVPALDAVVSRSADGNRIYIKVINTDAGRAIETRIDLRGATVDPEAEWTVLAADDPKQYNSFATPGAISPRQEKLKAGNRFSIRLPQRSVSVITLHVVR